LEVVLDTYEEPRTLYGGRLVLVRPDQYVVWAGDSAPDDPKALIRKVTGA
jgi:hypothetical protein